MSEQVQVRMLTMPTGEGKTLIEGHPLNVRKIIQGDLREKTWEVNGETYTSARTDGTLLYDSTDKRYRPWFLLAFESGRRYGD